MWEADDEPELAGWEPFEQRPTRSRGARVALRIVVVLGIVALVLPTVVVTVGIAADSAERSCALAVARDVPDESGHVVRFELFAPQGVGWTCYAVRPGDTLFYMGSLGLIPAGPPATSTT